MSETDLKAATLKALHALGLYAISVPSGAILKGSRCIRLAPKGTADILVILPPNGRAGWLELKDGAKAKTDKKRAELQRAFGEARKAEGCYHAQVVTVEEAAEAVYRWRFKENDAARGSALFGVRALASSR